MNLIVVGSIGIVQVQFNRARPYDCLFEFMKSLDNGTD